MLGENHGLTALLDRRPPSAWQQFIERPCLFLATKLYKWRPAAPFHPYGTRPVTVVCISDTHNTQPHVPHGDILIHAGDLTQTGTYEELQTTLDWLNTLSHPHKIVIAGNHDILLDPNDPCADPVAKSSLEWGNIVYLNSESADILCPNGRTLKVYGSPLTPRCGNCAFQYLRGRDVWTGQFPADTDILVTHGPPKGHLDAGHIGCQHLLSQVWRMKPRLHVFGHAHGGYGTETAQFDGLQKAYENAVISGGGLWNLGLAFLHFISAQFRSNFLGESPTAEALFVNAAALDGLRDDQQRRPIVVRM
ncbi:unnamed protein product [Periconia digitata]|uniref:Calcineurin-like phosphoesterase domain-containing protein n=1 Tax=Periconia digitata TaxID=1303443 RepID=A0A9W4XT39_9PLEO|nr:unnamed protein product [Periconia digitata]